MSHQLVLERIAQFKPAQLLEVENDVRTMHPNTVDFASNTKPDILEKLRRLLASIREDEIHGLALKLSSQKLRALLHLLCLNEDSIVLERAKKVIRYRLRRDLVFPAWKLLLNHYPVDNLQHVLQLLVEKYGCPWFQDEAKAQIWNRWLSSDNLSRSILQDIEASTPTNVGDFISNAGIPEGSMLDAAVWREILGKASVSLIIKIGPISLMRRAQAEQDIIQRRFAANYLCRLQKRSSWSNQVLAWIRQKYDVPPRSDSQNLFWRRIPEEIRREFRRWANETTIREFFETIHDPHGRFLFWRDFIDDIEDVRVVVGNQAMAMDFGHFGVVEFSHVGNAAYIYRADAFVNIRQLSRYAVASAFKNQKTVYKRIIHWEGWQYEWREVVRELLRR
ncbi:MAG: EH signature domain-containing protein [Acidobacteriota bacterium]|nr:EH signature domain-containing protein [Acidobacteriota bacterium]